jgi:uncharacterized protein YejL (UPF0352 family)
MNAATGPNQTNYVLIDYENVQPTELSPLQHAFVKTIVFVGASQTKIPLEVALGLQKLGPRASYIKSAGNGANALDFHLTFYLGALAAREPQAYFHIISKDTGFDPLIQHLRKMQIRVYRAAALHDLPWVKALPNQTQTEKIACIIAMLNKHKTNKPTSLKTLTGTINALFKKQLSEAEIQALIEALQRQNLISITEGKISYSLQDSS